MHVAQAITCFDRGPGVGRWEAGAPDPSPSSYTLWMRPLPYVCRPASTARQLSCSAPVCMSKGQAGGVANKARPRQRKSHTSWPPAAQALNAQASCAGLAREHHAWALLAPPACAHRPAGASTQGSTQSRAVRRAGQCAEQRRTCQDLARAGRVLVDQHHQGCRGERWAGRGDGHGCGLGFAGGLHHQGITYQPRGAARRACS